MIFGAISNIDKNTIGQAVRNEDSHISTNIAAGALCRKVIAPDTINAVLNDINIAKIKFLYLVDLLTKVGHLFREIIRLWGHLYQVSLSKERSYNYLPLPLVH